MESGEVWVAHAFCFFLLLRAMRAHALSPTSLLSSSTNSLCCLCGTTIAPNPSNMCVTCIRSQVDITEGLQKQVRDDGRVFVSSSLSRRGADLQPSHDPHTHTPRPPCLLLSTHTKQQITLLWCPTCGRYLQPPKHWTPAPPESKELLALCLKRVRGLGRVRLVDAGFIWTEPHSRRLKLKLTVQAEVLGGAILQQTTGVEAVVEPHQCIDCTRAATNAAGWTACVQVRQHVGHKRTFLYLEQVILRTRADSSCLAVRDVHGGLDFYFGGRAAATRFVEFVEGAVPARHRGDKQLVSHNVHTSSYRYKYTFSLEIAPICRDDLVCLPPKVSAALGGLGPICLVTRVTAGITLTDPATLREAVLDAGQFWRAPFRPLMGGRALVEYAILDVEPAGPSTKRWALADVQCCRASDLGRPDRVIHTRTHLGAVLRPGDSALGYDTGGAALAEPDLDAALAKGLTMPDAVLVRKSYEEARRRRRAKGERRPWVLKRLATAGAPLPDGDAPMEDEDGVAGAAEGGKGKRGRAAAAAAAAATAAGEADLERFMEDLEEDADLRARVALFRREGAGGEPATAGPTAMSDEDEEDEVPAVPLDELLDDLEALELNEGGGDGRGGDGGAGPSG
jgi:nonsense-mediated mRNA decay protein 3